MLAMDVQDIEITNPTLELEEEYIYLGQLLKQVKLSISRNNQKNKMSIVHIYSHDI